jgi:hypothetical protein
MRTKQPFKREKDMVTNALSYGAAALLSVLGKSSGQWCVSRTEFIVGSVIPDLVICTSPDGPPVPLGPVSYVDASMLAYIQQFQSRLVDEIRRDLYVSEDAFNKAVIRCERIGAISRSGDVVRPSGQMPDAEVVAFEFKLFRWREALQQAKAYADFCNEAYVVLGSRTTADSAVAIRQFIDAGVGLILQTETSLEVLVKARRTVPQTAARVQTIQKIALASEPRMV